MHCYEAKDSYREDTSQNRQNNTMIYETTLDWIAHLHEETRQSRRYHSILLREP